MASTSAPPSANSKNSAARGKQPLKPPNERFWVRYSPHHELPVSVAGSFLLHVLGIGLIALVLIGALSRIFGDPKPPPISPLQIEPGGGGGHKQGIGDAPGDGVVPHGKEALPEKVDKPLIAAKPRVQDPELKQIDKNPVVPLEVPAADAAATRTISEPSTDAVLGQLTDIGKQARAQIDGIIAGKGKGGTGSGGGEGTGVGTGVGGLKGPGGLENQRTKRQQRWVMIFNTRDGNDYLRQLQHLGAIVAVPQPDGGYLVYSDLAKRPFQGKREDIGTINRIYWVDDKAFSVESLAKAMGIVPPPPYIAAFFPESLEKDLRRKEEVYYKGDERNIKETKFQVMARGGRYEPIVVTRPELFKP